MSRYNSVTIKLTKSGSDEPFAVTFSEVDDEGMTMLQDGISTLVRDYLSLDVKRRTAAASAVVEQA